MRLYLEVNVSGYILSVGKVIKVVVGVNFSGILGLVVGMGVGDWFGRGVCGRVGLFLVV